MSLGTNTGGPLFSELLSDVFLSHRIVVFIILCVINVVFGLTQFNSSNFAFSLAVSSVRKKKSTEKIDFRAQTCCSCLVNVVAS